MQLRHVLAVGIFAAMVIIIHGNSYSTDAEDSEDTIGSAEKSDSGDGSGSGVPLKEGDEQKCEDKSSHCKAFKKDNYCYTRQDYVFKKCIKTCEFCGPESDEFDRDANCPIWGEKGFCASDKSVRVKCPHSCTKYKNAKPVPLPHPGPSQGPVPVTNPAPVPVAAPWPVPYPGPSQVPHPVPVPTPVSAPVPNPVSFPGASPAPNPVTSPVPSPEPNPVTSPVPSPAPNPVTSPVPSPAPNPVTSPVPSPAQNPVTSPVAGPVVAPNPMSVPTTPVAAPAPAPFPAPFPVTPVASPVPSLDNAKKAHKGRKKDAEKEEASH